MINFLLSLESLVRKQNHFKLFILVLLFLLHIRQKKICVFPVTRPILIFPSNPKVFIGILKKMKFYHTQPTLFAAIFIGFATFDVIFEAVLLFKHLF